MSFPILEDKGMVIKLLQKFPCVFVLFYLETNSKSGKIYLIATMKCTWCAYLSPPLNKTKDYVHRNTVGLVHSLHEVTQLG